MKIRKTWLFVVGGVGLILLLFFGTGAARELWVEATGTNNLVLRANKTNVLTIVGGSGNVLILNSATANSGAFVTSTHGSLVATNAVTANSGAFVTSTHGSLVATNAVTANSAALVSSTHGSIVVTNSVNAGGLIVTTNVGVGVTTALEKLHVSGNFKLGYYAAPAIYNANLIPWYTGAPSQVSYVWTIFGNGGSSNAVLTMSDTARVGILTMLPSAALSVNGTTTTGALVVTNRITNPVVTLSGTNVDCSLGHVFTRAAAAAEAYNLSNGGDGQSITMFVTNSTAGTLVHSFGPTNYMIPKDQVYGVNHPANSINVYQLQYINGYWVWACSANYKQ